jgi:hypothetical protein
MTPKEKAIELVDKFYQTTPNECFVNEPIGIAGRYKAWNQSKQCALIAVDEIINTIVHKDQDERLAFELLGNKFYWEDVRREIENL